MKKILSLLWLVPSLLLAEIPEIKENTVLTRDGTGFLAPGTMTSDLSDRSIIYVAGGRWPNPGSINVCWVNPEAGGEIVGDLQGWLNNEYRRAGIGFNWQGKCTAFNTPNQIRVFFKRTHSWNTNGGISGGGGLSYLGPVNAQLGNASGEGPGTMNIQIAKDVNGYSPTNWRQWTINVTRATATHEFGHAIGLAHEQDRNDAPACGDQRGGLANGGNYRFVGAYDAKSIMNYCRDPSNISSLSDGDIAGIKALYPSGGGGGGGGQPAGSYTIRLKATGKCLDVPSNGTANGLKLQEWDCNGTTAQSFEAIGVGGGWWTLKGTNSKKCLDVPSSSRNNGARIQIWDCNGTGAQKFALDDRGGGWVAIRNQTSGKVFDVDLKGGYLQQWDVGYEANKQFGFFKVGGSKPETVDVD